MNFKMSYKIKAYNLYKKYILVAIVLDENSLFLF